MFGEAIYRRVFYVTGFGGLIFGGAYFLEFYGNPFVKIQKKKPSHTLMVTLQEWRFRQWSLWIPRLHPN